MTHYFPLLIDKLLDQILLVGFSIFMAIILGVPMGIYAAKIPKLKLWIFRLVNIFQTVPSLALLAFFVPLLGIGVLPAMLTMSLYAILPIVANTQTALERIPPEQIEAADALGFTFWQKLRIVELPLAFPIIIAGIRTAAVMNVGIATIAAYIGAGGLGDFIFQGIATANFNLILLGAIPTALLATTVDWLLRKLEERVSFFHINKKPRLVKWPMLIAISVFFSGFIFFQKGYFADSGNDQVVIATKNFTEQLIIGHMVAELLEKHTNLNIVRKFNLGSTDVCHRAMLKGEIDIYPEYTGTAFLHVLKRPFQDLDNTELFENIKNAYHSQYHILWCPPLGFNNSTVIAYHPEAPYPNQAKTITDIQPYAKQSSIGTPAEFYSRPDGYSCLKNYYRIEFKHVMQMEPIFLNEAIKNHNVDFILTFSTNPYLQYYSLKTLKDDQNIFPHYDASLLVREDLLDRHPEVLEVLKKLSNSLDNDTIKSLNYQVDILKSPPCQAAKSFLIAKNFI